MQQVLGGDLTCSQYRPDCSFNNQLGNGSPSEHHYESTCTHRCKRQECVTKTGNTIQRNPPMAALLPPPDPLNTFTAALVLKYTWLRRIFWSHDRLETWHWTSWTYRLPSIHSLHNSSFCLFVFLSTCCLPKTQKLHVHVCFVTQPRHSELFCTFIKCMYVWT